MDRQSVYAAFIASFICLATAFAAGKALAVLGIFVFSPAL